jgi:hypothetical protein
MLRRAGAAHAPHERTTSLFNPWTEWFRAAEFAYQTQSVVAMRLMKIAEGGPAAAVETQLMVAEKVAALAASQTAAALAIAAGSSPAMIASKAFLPMRTKVRANHRRLSRKR